MFISFFKYIFSFHFVTVIGIASGIFLFNTHSEQSPLSTTLSTFPIYLIGFIIVFSLHFLYWIFVDKGTFYNIKTRIADMMSDYVLLIISALSTTGTLFILTTFF